MYNSGGMERTVANKANYLQHRGHEITIMTTDQGNKKYFYDVHHEVKKLDLGLNFTANNNKNILYRTFVFLKKNRIFKDKLEKFLIENKQDIVVSLIMKSSGFLYKLNDSSIKIIEHHFSRQYYSLQGNAYKRNIFENIAYRYRDRTVIRNLKKIDCFVVLTHEDAKDWSKVLNNIVVIPNSIKFDDQIKAELNNKQAITIGRLDYQKGYDMLIPIWGKITCKHPEWKLYIYGSGNLYTHLSNLIKKYKLQDNVIIKDPIKNVNQILLENSIYLLPSRFEGLPMVLLESMALGLPPVAFKCKCGPNDLIEDGVNGFLVECFDEDDFVNKIITLIENKQLRLQMGERCKQSMKKYSHEVICNKWEDLFLSLISKKKRMND